MCVISLNIHSNPVKLGFMEPGLREVQAQLEATEPEMLAPGFLWVPKLFVIAGNVDSLNNQLS